MCPSLFTERWSSGDRLVSGLNLIIEPKSLNVPKDRAGPARVAVRCLPPVDSTKECQELYDREEAAEVDVLTLTSAK